MLVWGKLLRLTFLVECDPNVIYCTDVWFEKNEKIEKHYELKAKTQFQLLVFQTVRIQAFATRETTVAPIQYLDWISIRYQLWKLDQLSVITSQPIRFISVLLCVYFATCILGLFSFISLININICIELYLFVPFQFSKLGKCFKLSLVFPDTYKNTF